MTSVSSIQTRILDVPPSCIEVCPWDQTIFAVGTYLLHKEEHTDELGQPESADESNHPQKRTGTVELFRLSEDQSSFEHLRHCWCDYAILDLHFPILHDQANPCLWTANSTGSLTRHSLDASNTAIEKSVLVQVEEPHVLVLSFTFHPTDSRLLGVTLSDGCVAVVQIPPADAPGEKISATTIYKHDLEAWTMSFDLKTQRCLSGGDDAVIQCSALNSELNPGSDIQQAEPVALWKNRKLHFAGVTAILPLEDDLMVTGSYDDHLRVLSISKPPKMLADVNLEGGVWRLKLLNSREHERTRHYDILASCMHAGTRIVRVTIQEGAAPQIDIRCKFEEHESMNYGSDFVRAKTNPCDYTILSTSFYDKRLCLWNFRGPPPET